MTAPRWLWYSSVPGMAVPGMACPGMDGTGSYPLQVYIGHVAAGYFDYVDSSTSEMLEVVPGGWYSMYPVSSRAGLTVPPPDGCWLTTGNRFAPRIEFFHHANLAAARQVNVRLQAANAAKPPRKQPEGSPSYARAPESAPPSEAAVQLAAARARNAELQAARARGESVAC